MISSGSKPALIYLVYGDNRKYQDELTYSVLSALREAGDRVGDFQICLFCDDKNQRPDLPVEHYVISESELTHWSMQGTAQHAMKIYATIKALEIRAGKICFLDTDTVFLASPMLAFDRITSGKALMHAIDDRLRDQPIWQDVLRRVGNGDLSEFVHPDAIMYNSGFIGVEQSMMGALEEAKQLMKSLVAIENLFNMEQFALGAILDRDFGVTLGDDILIHYWGFQRHIYHGQLASVLATFDGEYTAEKARFLPNISAPSKPLMAKIRARLHAALHKMNSSEKFAYLAYQCSLMAKDEVGRKIWTNIAAGMLDGRPDAGGFARQHFARFTPETLKSIEDRAGKR